MAAISSSYRRPRGLMIALLVLGGVDLLLNLLSVATAGLTLADQQHLSAETLYASGGLVGAMLLLQMVLRFPQLVVRGLWARRLVRNIHLFQSFPVSQLWAWAGFFMPVVSLWLPGKTLLALSQAYGRRNPVLNGLCIAWSIARWLNCPSGGFILFTTFVAFHRHWQPVHGLALMLTLDAIGIVSSTLGLAITPWITRRQPRPDQLDHVEVFT